MDSIAEYKLHEWGELSKNILRCEGLSMKDLSQVHVLKVWSLARGAIWGGK